MTLRKILNLTSVILNSLIYKMKHPLYNIMHFRCSAQCLAQSEHEGNTTKNCHILKKYVGL